MIVDGGGVGVSKSKLIDICCTSINKAVANIRNIIYDKHDLFINNLLDELDRVANVVVKPVTRDNYKVFTLPKSEVKHLLKYVDVYDSKDLIKDSDDLNDDNHYKSLYNIIEMLNKICDCKEMSDKLNTSIMNSSNKPTSRITYRNDGLRLSITINRITYICMHESTADLSIKKDKSVFLQDLDIVGRSFVTLSKPLRSTKRMV